MLGGCCSAGNQREIHIGPQPLGIATSFAGGFFQYRRGLTTLIGQRAPNGAYKIPTRTGGA